MSDRPIAVPPSMEEQRKIRIRIHASSELRNRNPSVRAVQQNTV
jgi:hypothetical protein